MLKKKKYAKWGNDDEGPDWGDLKHNEKEEEPVLKKVKEVRNLYCFFSSQFIHDKNQLLFQSIILFI